MGYTLIIVRVFNFEFSLDFAVTPESKLLHKYFSKNLAITKAIYKEHLWIAAWQYLWYFWFHKKIVGLNLKKKLGGSSNSSLNSRSFFVQNHIDLFWNGFAHVVLRKNRTYLIMSSSVSCFLVASKLLKDMTQKYFLTCKRFCRPFNLTLRRMSPDATSRIKPCVEHLHGK